MRVFSFLHTLMFKQLCCLLALGWLCAGAVFAQDNAAALRLEQALELAQKNYPAIRAAQAARQAAEANVELTRFNVTAPRAELLAQENRATRNNVFGVLMPQSTLPAISGPDLGERTARSTWGSAVGFLISWEPFDFGARQAHVNLAQAQSKQAKAQADLSEFEATIAAADAFLAAVAAEQAVRVTRANYDRQDTFAQMVKTLADNQLRPGADYARATVEVVTAKNQILQAEQQAALARITLSEWIGQPGDIKNLDHGPLLEFTPSAAVAKVENKTLGAHPLALAQTAAIDVVRARQTTFEKSFYPKFNWQSAVFGRGTGARLDGTFRESRGFFPDTFNYATGFTLTFNVSDWFKLKAQRKVERFNLEAEQARYDQVVNTLKAQEARAKTMIETARQIAANTPAQVNAASETLKLAKVRYEHGLTNIAEIADAQRALAQAEIDEAVARLNVWRALLQAAKLNGDMKVFLDEFAAVQAQRGQ